MRILSAAAGLFMTAAFSGAGFAAPQSLFSDADALFGQRENNPAAIEQARNLYRQALNDGASSAADKIRAGKQLGRLALYQGTALTPLTDSEARKKIFTECWEQDLEKISPDKVGENAPYYYFKGACLGYWGEVASVFEALMQINNLLGTIEKGGQSDDFKNFEGGGNYRLSAGLHSNPKAAQIPLPSGKLYDPERALGEVRQALASPGLLDPDTGSQVSGADYYDNFNFLAKTYAALGDKANQKKALVDGIKAINDAKASTGLPADRIPESNFRLKSMQEDLAALGG